MPLGEHDVALVTGGARGLGGAIALALAAHGVRIGLVDAPGGGVKSVGYPLSSGDDLAAAASQVAAAGVQCATATVDVRDQQALRAAIDDIEQQLGPITIVVAAAAIGSVVDGEAMSDAHWDETVDINLHGFYNTARLTAPRLVERGHGHILAIVGDEARRGAPGLSHVAAASWAVVGLAKSIALEVAAAGVAVNVLCAGPVPSAFTSTDQFAANVLRGTDIGSLDEALATRHPNDAAWVDAGDAVSAATFLLGARGTAMTGSVLEVTNGLAALNSA